MAYMELGLYTEEFPHFLMSAVKWVPRSELTLKGSPNLEKMWFITGRLLFLLYHWELEALYSLCEFADHGEEVFVTPRVDRGRGPTQSIWRSDQGKVIPFLCSGARWFGFAG